MKRKKLEAEVGMMENNRNDFLSTYRTPLMDGGRITKDLETMGEINSS